MKLHKEFFTFVISHLHLTVLKVSTANGEQLELKTLSNSTCGSRQNVYCLQKHTTQLLRRRRNSHKNQCRLPSTASTSAYPKCQRSPEERKRRRLTTLSRPGCSEAMLPGGNMQSA